MCNSHVTCMIVSKVVQGLKSDSDSVEVLPPLLSDHRILLLKLSTVIPKLEKRIERRK